MRQVSTSSIMLKSMGYVQREGEEKRARRGGKRGEEEIERGRQREGKRRIK